ncbi:hypothetical protein Glove_187g65 [Diversispora epigaea]|uniref:Uncharacterized protein n=1 Tax=Diversispora epigaea TaxID=1348612 RepID=A0A397ILP1_9GLOM|nr:hypothetical protein Glove_187g65 [Diversispora epigaea]
MSEQNEFNEKDQLEINNESKIIQDEIEIISEVDTSHKKQTPCVIVDYIEDKIQTCSICYSYFLYNQNQLHSKNDKQKKCPEAALIQKGCCIGCGRYFTFYSRDNGFINAIKEYVPSVPFENNNNFYNYSNKIFVTSVQNKNEKVELSLFIINMFFIDTFKYKKNKTSFQIQQEINNPENLGKLFGQKLWYLRNEIRNKKSDLEFPKRHERNKEKECMNNIIPSLCLKKNKKIWNLAIIDNIDFKIKSFSFGNIYDVTRETLHATLRIAFQ